MAKKPRPVFGKTHPSEAKHVVVFGTVDPDEFGGIAAVFWYPGWRPERERVARRERVAICRCSCGIAFIEPMGDSMDDEPHPCPRCDPEGARRLNEWARSWEEE